MQKLQDGLQCPSVDVNAFTPHTKACYDLCWIPSHVGIKGNEMADNAAKEGIRSVITQSKIPPESFFPHLSKLCMEEWQDSWDSTPTN